MFALELQSESAGAGHLPFHTAALSFRITRQRCNTIHSQHGSYSQSPQKSCCPDWSILCAAAAYARVASGQAGDFQLLFCNTMTVAARHRRHTSSHSLQKSGQHIMECRKRAGASAQLLSALKQMSKVYQFFLFDALHVNREEHYSNRSHGAAVRRNGTGCPCIYGRTDWH